MDFPVLGDSIIIMGSAAERRGLTCREEDGRPVLARGWCKLHYNRWQANIRRVRQALPRGKRNECWEDWGGANYSDGRPCFSWREVTTRQKRKIHAMRAVLIMATGPDYPRHLEAAHRCDNPLCVNPNHGFWATHAENCSGVKP